MFIYMYFIEIYVLYWIAVLRYFTVFHGISRCFTVCRAISRYFTVYHTALDALSDWKQDTVLIDRNATTFVIEAESGRDSFSANVKSNGDIAVDDFVLTEDYCEYQGDLLGEIREITVYFQLIYIYCMENYVTAGWD